MHLEMDMTAKTGMVHHQKAIYIKTTQHMSGMPGTEGDTAVPATIEEYIEGNKVYVNVGQGWTEDTNTEQLLQSLQPQFLTQDISFGMLHNIRVSQAGGKNTYTATLDSSELMKMMEPLLQSVLSSDMLSTPDISPQQFTSFMHQLLKHMNEQVQITTQPVGGKMMVTNQKVTLDLTFPMTELPIPTEEKTSITADVTSFTIHETMNANYTYNNVPLTPPSGLPAAASSSK
jgi:hypothetical protein